MPKYTQVVGKEKMNTWLTIQTFVENQNTQKNTPGRLNQRQYFQEFQKNRIKLAGILISYFYLSLPTDIITQHYSHRH